MKRLVLIDDGRALWEEVEGLLGRAHTHTQILSPREARRDLEKEEPDMLVLWVHSEGLVPLDPAWERGRDATVSSYVIGGWGGGGGCDGLGRYGFWPPSRFYRRSPRAPRRAESPNAPQPSTASC